MKDDNYLVSLHRQARWPEPSVELRHHHGDRNIDRVISMTLAQGRALRRAAERDAQGFVEVLEVFHPQFVRDVGPAGIDAYRLLFLDLAGLL